MWVAPILAIANLVVGLVWAFGAASIVVGKLNMFTSMMAVVLLGLGIDFSIHLISGFTEWRAMGDSISDALHKTFHKSGKGIITGGLTTACAFLALLVSRSRGMNEMGFVTGLGLLSVLLTTFLFLPVLLVFRERLVDKKRLRRPEKVFVQKDISFRFLGRAGKWMSTHYVFTLIFSVAASAFLIWSAFQIKWDYDYRSMEPEGLESMLLIDTVMDKFDLSMDYALVLADGVEDSRELVDRYKELGSVAVVEDVSTFLPHPDQQEKRTPHIEEISSLIRASEVQTVFGPDDLLLLQNEIERLEMNIMEMQDMAFIGGQDKVDNKCKDIVGDPDNPDSVNKIRELVRILGNTGRETSGGLLNFQQVFAPYFKQSILRMCSTEAITMDDLPDSILDRYSNKTRDTFLITVYPSVSIYDGEFLKQFVNDIERVSDKATGTPPLFLALMRILGRDGRNAMLLTLVIVFLLLLADFHRPGLALMAMIPLAMGVFWMVGFMKIVGWKLSMMSVMGLPLIIGIGIDDGVHIMHRWRHEGNGRIQRVFSSTGKAILLTSLTTMFAFGSMVFSIFPAWTFFGGSLFLGVGACFLTTVIILPGIFGLAKRREK
jgi:predicted RND superfamily exporter protein